MGGAALAEVESIVPDLGASRRRDLLAAGLRQFHEVGFHGATTRSIAESAGMSSAALYAHYPSKSALLYELELAGHRAALDAVEQGLRAAAPATGLDGVLTYIGVFVRWHAEHASIARLIQYEFGALTGQQRATIVRLRRRTERLLERQVSDGIADGSVHVDDPQATVRALLSLAIDVARWYSPDGRLTPEELGTQYVGLAQRMVAPR